MSGTTSSKKNSAVSRTAFALRRIIRDYEELKVYPLEGIELVSMQDHDVFEWHVNMIPMHGSFKGLKIHLKLTFPQDYPKSPPKVQILTMIPHTNVFSKDYICLDLLQPSEYAAPYEGWSSGYSAGGILVQLQAFFFDTYVLQEYGELKHTLWDDYCRRPKEEVIEQLYQAQVNCDTFYCRACGYKGQSCKLGNNVDEGASSSHPNNNHLIRTGPLSDTSSIYYKTVERRIPGVFFENDIVQFIVHANKVVHNGYVARMHQSGIGDVEVFSFNDQGTHLVSKSNVWLHPKTLMDSARDILFPEGMSYSEFEDVSTLFEKRSPTPWEVEPPREYVDASLLGKQFYERKQKQQVRKGKAKESNGEIQTAFPVAANPLGDAAANPVYCANGISKTAYGRINCDDVECSFVYDDEVEDQSVVCEEVTTTTSEVDANSNPKGKGKSGKFTLNLNAKNEAITKSAEQSRAKKPKAYEDFDIGMEADASLSAAADTGRDFPEIPLSILSDNLLGFLNQADITSLSKTSKSFAALTTDKSVEFNLGNRRCFYTKESPFTSDTQHPIGKQLVDNVALIADKIVNRQKTDGSKYSYRQIKAEVKRQRCGEDLSTSTATTTITNTDNLLGVGVSLEAVADPTGAFGDKKELLCHFDILSFDVRKTAWKKKLDYWFPIAINREHFERVLPYLFEVLKELNTGEVGRQTQSSGKKFSNSSLVPVRGLDYHEWDEQKRQFIQAYGSGEQDSEKLRIASNNKALVSSFENKFINWVRKANLNAGSVAKGKKNIPPAVNGANYPGLVDSNVNSSSNNGISYAPLLSSAREDERQRREAERQREAELEAERKKQRQQQDRVRKTELETRLEELSREILLLSGVERAVKSTERMNLKKEISTLEKLLVKSEEVGSSENATSSKVNGSGNAGNASDNVVSLKLLGDIIKSDDTIKSSRTNKKKSLPRSGGKKNLLLTSGNKFAGLFHDSDSSEESDIENLGEEKVKVESEAETTTVGQSPDSIQDTPNETPRSEKTVSDSPTTTNVTSSIEKKKTWAEITAEEEAQEEEERSAAISVTDVPLIEAKIEEDQRTKEQESIEQKEQIDDDEGFVTVQPKNQKKPESGSTGAQKGKGQVKDKSVTIPVSLKGAKPVADSCDHARKLPSIPRHPIHDLPAHLVNDILTVIPKLMNSLLVPMMKGDLHASQSSLDGYMGLHHLLLLICEKFPIVRETVEQKIEYFISDPIFRHKANCPNIGEFLTYISVSERYSWKSVAEPVVKESFSRAVMWTLQDHPELANGASTGRRALLHERLEKSFLKTYVGRRLLAFHCWFLENVGRVEHIHSKQDAARRNESDNTSTRNDFSDTSKNADTDKLVCEVIPDTNGQLLVKETIDEQKSTMESTIVETAAKKVTFETSVAMLKKSSSLDQASLEEDQKSPVDFRNPVAEAASKSDSTVVATDDTIEEDGFVVVKAKASKKSKKAPSLTGKTNSCVSAVTPSTISGISDGKSIQKDGTKSTKNTETELKISKSVKKNRAAKKNAVASSKQSGITVASKQILKLSPEEQKRQELIAIQNVNFFTNDVASDVVATSSSGVLVAGKKTAEKTSNNKPFIPMKKPCLCSKPSCILEKYEKTFGIPSANLLDELQNAVKRIFCDVKHWAHYFREINIKPLSPREVEALLVNSIKESEEAAYHDIKRMSWFRKQLREREIAQERQREQEEERRRQRSTAYCIVCGYACGDPLLSY